MAYQHLFDKMIVQIDQGIKTLWGAPRFAARANPAEQLSNDRLSDREKKHVAGLMRVNHAGEVCAQALYQGQALTASLPTVRAKMQQAASEENDHLAWCEQRLTELASAPSHLNILWYAGSLCIGALAGLVGDKWSLGFVAETERQVVQHLARHLQSLPQQDKRSRAILTQMQADETHHATVAIAAGAANLPAKIQVLMKFMSRLMTKSAYFV